MQTEPDANKGEATAQSLRDVAKASTDTAAAQAPARRSTHPADRLIDYMRSHPLVKWALLIVIPAGFIAGFWNDIRGMFNDAPVIPLVNPVRLGVMWKTSIGEDIPVDESTPILSKGTALLLSFSDHPGHYKYLLEIDGAGTATLYDEAQVREADWKWQIAGVPNTQTLMMIVSKDKLSASAQNDLIKQVEDCFSPDRENTKHQVGAGLQYVWNDQQYEVKKLSIDERPPGWPPGTPTTWCDKLITLIKERELHCSGVSVPVAGNR